MSARYYLAEYAKLRGLSLREQIAAALNYFRAAGYTEVSFSELSHTLQLKTYENSSKAGLLKKKLGKMGYIVYGRSGESFCLLAN